MAFKLKTSKATEEILCRIEASENIPWTTLLKLSIALSLRQPRLQPEDFSTNSFGRELNRQTITGDSDAVFKCLIELHEGVHLKEEDYFPQYVKAHIDRGAKLLMLEFQYGNDLLSHLASLEEGI